MIRTFCRQHSLKWFENEPELIATLYREATNENVTPSFDTPTNQQRIQVIQVWWQHNLPEMLASLDDTERIALNILTKNFGWLVYESLDNLMRFLSSSFQVDRETLHRGFEQLCSKRFLFNYEPLTHYSFLFLSPFIELQTFSDNIEESLSDQLYNLFPHLIGLIAYLIAYAPRSSEANEIHLIDFQKLQKFFESSSHTNKMENLLKNLAHVGLIQKYNNRVVVQKNIIEKLKSLSLSSMLSLAFLYETLERLEFKKSSFLTLQWLAYSQNEVITLSETFFHFIQHIESTLPRGSIKSFKTFLQKEEQNFLMFIKHLEKQNIIKIERSHPLRISRQDNLRFNPFYKSLLKKQDLSGFFDKQTFIVESNGEIIVEPNVHPHIHIEVIFIAEPKEIHTIAVYQITKKSVYKALAYGYTVENIINFLQKHSLHPVPTHVIQNIQNYAQHFIQPIEGAHHIVQFSSTESNIIADHFSRESIEIEPHTFLFFEEERFQDVKKFCQKNNISFKESIDFLHKNIAPYSVSLEHHIKHLQHFLDIMESQSIFLPQQDILKIRMLSCKEFTQFAREKSSEN